LLLVELQLLLNLIAEVFKWFLSLLCLTTKGDLITLLEALELAIKEAEEGILKALSHLVLSDLA
jgi:hypothetical protein